VNDLLIARALHVVAVVHWIGGVAMVTLVILPALRRVEPPAERLASLERLEGRFAPQARVSVTVAGLSGFYMSARLDLWARFFEPGYWWMHAMVLMWLLFTLALFVAEPLFLHAWVHRRALASPHATFAVVEQGHRVMLALTAITTFAAVLGAHGWLF